jgi:protein O-mannosyl-transferase
VKRQKKAVPPAPVQAVEVEAKLANSRQFFLAALALTALVLLAYSNSFSTGFALDNRGLILQDTRIQAATPENVNAILHHSYWWPTGESGLYRPLTTLSYLLNYAILGDHDHPAGYHRINFLFHVANVLLLFALLLRLLRGRNRAFWMALAIAMLWAVHPVLTESVTNIAGRADVLAGFGVLGGFLCYLESREATGWRLGAWLTGLALATLFGAFSKESAVVLPGVIVLYEVACGRNWRRMMEGLVATILPIGILLAQRAVVLSAAMPAEYPFLDNPISGAGFLTGRLTALKVLARYMALAVWPVNLSADYSYQQISVASGSIEDWICWLAVAGVAVLAVIFWKRDRLAFFFVAFAFLNLLPASNLLFPIGTMMAERLLYLPLIGLIAAAVLEIDAAAPRWRIPAMALAIVAGVIAAGFVLRTWMRNFDWNDDKTMALSGVQSSPRSYKFHRLLAAQLLVGDPTHHDVDGAAAEADRAVAILDPVPDELNSSVPWDLAAVCHRIKGGTLKADAARAQYEEALKLSQRSVAIDAASRAAYDRRHGVKGAAPVDAAENYRTLASIYLRLEQPAPALTAATEAQKIDPGNVTAYEEMAESLAAQDRGEDAAIALAQGMFATSSQTLRTDLVRLYQSGVDTKGCAVVAGPRGPALNPSCEVVVRDFCEATLRANRLDLRAHLTCGK